MTERPRATGVPPVRGISEFTVSRRNLPHWQEPGSVYFLTWRTVPGFQLLDEDRTATLESILHWDQKRWIVFAAVVMPDHVHALVKPTRMAPQPEAANGDDFYPLKSILHSVKSFAAHRINRQHKRTGRVWQDERYDRIMRDDREFEQTWEYICQNPVDASLARSPEEYPWFYRIGWNRSPEEHRRDAGATNSNAAIDIP